MIPCISGVRQRERKKHVLEWEEDIEWRYFRLTMKVIIHLFLGKEHDDRT